MDDDSNLDRMNGQVGRYLQTFQISTAAKQGGNYILVRVCESLIVSVTRMTKNCEIIFVRFWSSAGLSTEGRMM